MVEHQIMVQRVVEGSETQMRKVKLKRGREEGKL
jgi:hypothetical protein